MSYKLYIQYMHLLLIQRKSKKKKTIEETRKKEQKKGKNMRPERVIMSMKVTAVVFALAALIYSVYTGNILNIVWGIIFAVGCIFMASVIIRMYKTDYLGELDDENN